MSAFKFIGYYDENSLRIYETCKGLNSNNVSKIYYYKDYSEYLFLKGVEKRVPTVKELERIHIYVMQKEMCKKEWLLRLGTSTAALMLIYLLKYAYGMCQDKQEDIYAKQEVQVMKEVEKYNYAIDYTDIKNKLIDMINLAEVSLVDRNYRILYYLYYAAFVNDLDNYDFLENIIPKYGGNARLSYQDLFAFYISDKFNYSSVISDPKGDSLKVTYENLDMFLELNILLEQDVIEEHISREEYADYIKIFGNALRERDADLYRVWAYKVSHSSMFGELVNLKYLVYKKFMDMSK